jgi:alanyl-tRNA synthetase
VRNTGNIGAFRIVAETAVAAGTRRLEAVTGLVALDLAQRERSQLAAAANLLKVPAAKVAERVQELADELKRVRRDLEKALAPDFGAELAKLRGAATAKDGAHSAIYERPGLQAKDALELLKLAQKALDPFAGIVLSAVDGEVQITAAVSPALTARIKAGDVVKQIATLLGGGGGGRPESAQGKGKDAARLPEARQLAESLLAAAKLR